MQPPARVRSFILTSVESGQYWRFARWQLLQCCSFLVLKYWDRQFEREEKISRRPSFQQTLHSTMPPVRTPLPLRRWSSNLLCGLSLLIFLLAMGIWVRSYFVRESIAHVSQKLVATQPFWVVW